MIRTDLVGRAVADREPLHWTATETLLYAISVGAGDGEPGSELALTTENSTGVEHQVLPTFLAMLENRGLVTALRRGDLGDFGLAQVLHAGQEVVVHAPIPPAGSAACTRTVTGVWDKGANALVEMTVGFADVRDGAPLATSVSRIMVVGEGGCGNTAVGPPPTAAPLPERAPDRVVSAPTHPNQALLYRLNGDRNPLHSDPVAALAAGFHAPILHGLCTFGFGARAVLAVAAGGDTARLAAVSAPRFTAPVRPGERLDTDIWLTDDGARFRMRVGDRVVIDRGACRLR